MVKVNAFSHFGSAAATARALGITDQAVSKWGDVVPLESALAIETLTQGALRIDVRCYPKLARANRLVRRLRHKASSLNLP